MKQSKEISKDIYDVDAWIDEGIGAPGTEKRKKAEELAIAEFNAQLLLDARREAKVTQAELAERVGVDKAYECRPRRGRHTREPAIVNCQLSIVHCPLISAAMAAVSVGE